MKNTNKTEELSLKRFDLLAIVGQGAFGKVRIVAEKKSKKEYALKYMDKKEIISQKATTHVFRERMLLQQLASQFIVGLRYAFQDDDHLFMILELAKGGDLRFHMNMDKQPLDDCTLQIYAAELGFALDYMHKQKIIHRDLKPENILLDQDGHILLTDFNIAVSVAEKLPTSESGTLIYMAPEMLTDTPYSYSVDWWATGTILYECIYKKLPFCNGDEDPDTIKELIAKKKLDFPAENACKVKITPNQARDVFMAELLERDVSKRLGSENNGLGFETQMKCHPYLSKLDWKQVEEKKLTPKYKPNNDKDAMNFSPALLIEEMMDGGSEIAYKPRKKKKDPNAKKTLGEKLSSKLSGMFSKGKSKQDLHSPTKKSREEVELEEMEQYFTTFDYELPDQIPMQLPPRESSKSKIAGSPSTEQINLKSSESNDSLGSEQSPNGSVTDVSSPKPAAVAITAGLTKEKSVKPSPLRDTLPMTVPDQEQDDQDQDNEQEPEIVALRDKVSEVGIQDIPPPATELNVN